MDHTSGSQVTPHASSDMAPLDHPSPNPPQVLYMTPNHRVTKARYVTSSDPRGYVPVYEYPLNGQWIMMDTDDGYVLWTGIWKADIVKILESQPDLASKLRRVALELARRVAWNIRYDLVPLFGPISPISGESTSGSAHRVTDLFESPVDSNMSLVPERAFDSLITEGGLGMYGARGSQEQQRGRSYSHSSGQIAYSNQSGWSSLAPIKQEPAQEPYEYSGSATGVGSQHISARTLGQYGEQFGYSSPQRDAVNRSHVGQGISQMRRGSVPHISGYPAGTASNNYPYQEVTIKQERNPSGDSGYGGSFIQNEPSYANQAGIDLPTSPGQFSQYSQPISYNTSQDVHASSLHERSRSETRYAPYHSSQSPMNYGSPTQQSQQGFASAPSSARGIGFPAQQTQPQSPPIAGYTPGIDQYHTQHPPAQHHTQSQFRSQQASMMQQLPPRTQPSNPQYAATGMGAVPTSYEYGYAGYHSHATGSDAHGVVDQQRQQSEELTARFESQTGSEMESAQKNKGGEYVSHSSRHKLGVPPGLLNSVSTPTKTSPEKSMDHLLPGSLPLRWPGHSPDDDVEMRSLASTTETSTEYTRKPVVAETIFLPHMASGDSTQLATLESIQSCEETALRDKHSRPSVVSRPVTDKLLDSVVEVPDSLVGNEDETQTKNHKTIPISKLFGRDATPLHLPELDAWLSQLPHSQFTYPKAAHSNSAPKAFPPMDLLKEKKLEDLVHNSPPPPIWRDWNSIGSTLVNLALSIMVGHRMDESFFGVRFGGRMFTNYPTAGNSSGRWRTLFLGTIPNILALNFGGKLLQSISFLGVLTMVSGGMLFWFQRLTARWLPNATPEGLLSRDPARGTHATPLVSFVLTVLYLPLSTISVHAITWSSDFWPVENPFISYNGTEMPDVQPIGPSSVYHGPLDFCWTTTMRKDEVNYAPVAVTLGILTLVFMTFWFPIRLRKTIRSSLPAVEVYDSLGQRRSEEEIEHEYRRLLERDKSPFNFLYNEYRREWGSFKALYLGGKLTSLLIVAIISPDSCLMLKISNNRVSRNTLEITRQSFLLAVMIAFLLVQSLANPFVDPISNASEWTSRMNFVLTSLLGLLVALDIPGQVFWNGWALYALDISPESQHLQHRIWKESLSTLLLASPQCQMPTSQRLVFAEGIEVASQNPVPPYLLDFSLSPAERHIENLKILREIGGPAYEEAVNESRIHYKLITGLRQKILQHMVGPDAFWFPKGNTGTSCPNAADYFGNAWCLPFPLTVIIRYDISGGLTTITNITDIQEFVRQNETRIVEKQKKLRIALRCLDGVIVQWPYTHTELIGNRFRWIGGKRYHACRTTDYHEAKFCIRRRGSLQWKNTNLASGFDVSLEYSKKLVFDGSLIGLNVGLQLTPQLARFLLLNKATLESRMLGHTNVLRDYRTYILNEVESKFRTLSYGFLTNLYASPMDPASVARLLAQNELDARVTSLAVGYEDAFQTMDERMRYVRRGPVEAWWFLLWISIHNTPLRLPIDLCLDLLLKRSFDNVDCGLHQSIGMETGGGYTAGSLIRRFTSILENILHLILRKLMPGAGRPFKATERTFRFVMRARRAYRWETLMEDNSIEASTRGLSVLRDHRWHFWHEEKKNIEEYQVSWRGKLSLWFGLSPIRRLHWRTGEDTGNGGAIAMREGPSRVEASEDERETSRDEPNEGNELSAGKTTIRRTGKRQTNRSV
ncbi:hypothetical protein RHS01_08294 [Rhizoctonia solani]|uniref:Uncharacterized protein n=1 Tax=Rhizoctonia solani TaxID=456999 RepID=A0A8H7M2N9_9AGAM|nr:hypothetical protein RHS01_08294 [Rhizoctonia solani]